MNNMQQGGYGNPQAAYKQTAVGTATPEKLIVMLYVGALKFLHLGEKAIEEKEYEIAHENLTRVQDILTELNVTLDMEKGGEIAANLRELYSFYYQEVVKANIAKDAAYLQPVKIFLETFRDVWIETAKIARMGAK